MTARHPRLADYISVTDAAHIIGRNASNVRHLIRVGKITAEPRGNLWLILKSDAEYHWDHPPSPGRLRFKAW